MKATVTQRIAHSFNQSFGVTHSSREVMPSEPTFTREDDYLSETHTKKSTDAFVDENFQPKAPGILSSKARMFAYCIAALLALPGKMQADQIWDGGGADNLWNTAANWGANTLPTFTNTIIFAGTVQTTTSNNLTADSIVGGISFTNTTTGQAFALGGNRITLGGNIVLSAVATGSINDTIGLDMVLNGTRLITTATNHSLTISGLISESSAAIGGLTKQGGSGTILTLSNNSNSFTGPLTLISGTLSFATIADAGTASALGAGGTIITGNSAGSTGTLSYTGSGSTTNRQIQIGSGTSTTSTVGVIISNVGTGALVFSNANFNVPYTGAALTATKTLTLNSNSGNGNNTISGIISDNNNSGGAIAVTKDGGSTSVWVLSGLNTYSGQSRIDVGVLSVNSLADSGTASSLGTGSSNPVINIGSVSSNGTLLYTGSAITTTNRQVQIGRSTVSAGSATIQNDGTGTLTFSNPNFNTSDTTITNVSAARTLTLRGTNTSNNTISGIISNNLGSTSVVGTITVNKSDSGVWALAGTNTYTGGTNVNTGVLSFLNTNARPVTGTTTVAAGATLGLGVATSGSFFTSADVDSLLAGTFAGVTNDAASRVGIDTTAGDFIYASSILITTRGLTKVGPNALTLTGANSHSGGTLLVAGTLNVNNAAALGTGTFTVTGGTLDNTTAGPLTLSTNNPVAFNGSFVFGGAQDLNLGSGVVSIGGASRSLTLNNSTTLTMGQLQWSSDLDRTLTVTQGTGTDGRLVLTGFQLNVLGTATATRTRTIAGTGNVDINGAVVDGNSFANNLTYSGTGTLRLLTANSYTGSTSITGAGGVLDVGALTTGALGNGGLHFSNGGILQGNGTFTRDFSGTSTATAGQIAGTNGGFAAKGGTLTVNFGGLGAQKVISTGNSRFGTNFVFGSTTADSAVVVVNPLDLNTAPRTFTVISGLGTDSAELQGVISGSTGDGIIKAGNGLLILSALNTFTGTTTISAGTLQLGSGVGGGTAGNVASSSGVVNSGTLAFNRSSSITFAVPISGSGAVNQIGSGTITLTGANSYTGPTTISAGTLSVGLTENLGGAASNLILDGGTLRITGTTLTSFSGIGHAVSLTAGKMVGLDINNAANIFTADQVLNQTTGGLTKLGTGTLILNQANTYSGATTVTVGVLRLENALAIPGGVAATGGTSNITFNGGVIGLTAASGDFTRSTGTGPDRVRWVTDTGGGFAAIGGNRNVNIGGAGATVNWSNTGGVFGSALILSDVTSDSTVTVLNPIDLNFPASSRTVTVNNGSVDIDAVMAGVISSQTTANNGTRFIKNGLGTLALTAANTYVSGSFTGSTANNPTAFGTTISAGTLQLGNGGTTGSISALTGTAINSDVSIASGAFFAFNRSNALTVANVITGAGAVNQIGTGTTTLTGSNTYTGATTISAGTLQVGNGTDAGSIGTTSAISNSGALVYNVGNGTRTLGAVISGNGTVTQNSALGSLTLTGANTYNGGTSVTNGTLLLNNTAGTSGTGTGAVNTANSTILGGTGTLSPGSGNGISVGGSLAPGDPAANNGVGTLTFTPVNGDAAFTSTSTLDFQLLTAGLHGYNVTYNGDGTLNTLSGTYTNGGNDRLIFNGGAAANKLDFTNLGASNFNVTFAGNYTPAALDLFDLLDWANLSGVNHASAITGLNLGQLDLPSLSGSLAWDTTKWTSDGVVAIYDAVPEPSKALLLMGGINAALLLRRRASLVG